MNRKYLILYLIVATVGLVMATYQVITSYPDFNYGRIALDVLAAVAFYYLAYKTYHEKKDRELM